MAHGTAKATKCDKCIWNQFAPSTPSVSSPLDYLTISPSRWLLLWEMGHCNPSDPKPFWRGFWKCPELRRSFVQKIPSHFANQVYCPFQSNSARPRGSCNAPEFNPKLSQQLTPSGLSSSLQVHFNCASNILAHVWYDIIFSCMILYSLDLSCMIFYSLSWSAEVRNIWSGRP